jgi:hypothetical protein
MITVTEAVMQEMSEVTAATMAVTVVVVTTMMVMVPAMAAKVVESVGVQVVPALMLVEPAGYM